MTSINADVKGRQDVPLAIVAVDVAWKSLCVSVNGERHLLLLILVPVAVVLEFEGQIHSGHWAWCCARTVSAKIC